MKFVPTTLSVTLAVSVYVGLFGSGSTYAAASATTRAVTAVAKPTDANVSAVVAAAQAFVATLNSSQQASLTVSYSLANARRWSNLPASFVPRNGVAFGALTAAQLAAAQTLLDTALSPAGSKLHTDLRMTDAYLASLGRRASLFGDSNIYMAFVGAPSNSSPWILQLTAHHLTYNLCYNTPYKSPTPAFIAVEPNLAFTFQGTTYDPLLAQRTAMGNLGAALAKYPTAKLSGTYDDLLFGANGPGNTDGDLPKAYPTGSSNRGVLFNALSPADKELVKATILSYVNTQTGPGLADLKAAYLSDTALAQTYVAYAGGTSIAEQGNYFRIDGPRVWIEWSVQGGQIIRNDIHPHSIWRDKVADYGGAFK